MRWLLALLTLFVAACGGGGGNALPQGDDPVQLDPQEFTSQIDNPFWPMAHGSRWVYRETDAEGAVRRVVVTVTNEAKRIVGIDALVVHDVVIEDGKVKEDTHDWYGQDRDGNVWYLGEATKEYENGKVSTEGSWEAGVDGAQAGILLPGDPKPGLTYRQEYYKGHAEDAAEVLSVNKRTLHTRETTALEPKVAEEKVYTRGIGPVREQTVRGGSDRSVLLRFERGR